MSGQHSERRCNLSITPRWIGGRNDDILDFRATTQDERRSLRCLPFLLLALMVFAWGTAYKLSLYKASPKDGTAPAKLCTRASEAARSALRDAADGQALTLVSLATLFFAGAVTSHDLCARGVEDGQPVHPSPFHPPAALDLRPPPMRALSL
jgi:hypothetical protein